MPQFRYVAKNPQGKVVDGVIECNDRAAAIRQVELQRFVPIKIELAPAAGNAAKSASSPAVKKPDARPAKSAAAEPKAAPKPEELSHAAMAVQTMTHNQRYLFTEQLGHLLGAGMTLDEGLGIMVKRMKHPKLQGLSRGLHQSLIEGRSLSQAMKDYPKIFSPLYVNMVAAGEVSGALPDILKRLVSHLSDLKGLRERVQQALVYPALLVVAGIGLVIIFITVMVPQLTAFFKNSGATLPAATQALLKMNDIITQYWWALILGVMGLVMALKAFTRSPQGRLAWDTFTWNFPVFSMVIRYRFYAQFARTLGTLVDNGVILLRALELLGDIAGNTYVAQRMDEVRRAVVDGATLSTALTEQKLFPELFVDMLAVGEQTGRFGETMHNIASVYERELDKQVNIISTLIPPLVMLAVAAMVGFVVFGILSAVFSLTQTLHTGH